MSRSQVLLSYAFRPLFLLMTAYALVVVPVWVLVWVGWVPMPSLALLNPIWWHAHEMLFGFAGAAIGGFLLTAVATWTGRPPVAGAPLLALALLWLAARLLLFLPLGNAGSVMPAAAAADLGYDVLLLGLMSRELLSARNRRNYKVLVLLALLAAANTAFYFGVGGRPRWVDPALLGTLWIVILLISLIAGRVVPAFTRNWLRLHGASPDVGPPPFDRVDLAATLALVTFACLTLVETLSFVTAATGLIAGVLLLFRVARWQGLRTRTEPLVWILHIAFLWIPVGVLLLAGAALGWWPASAGIHALSVGAITTMIVAVASRAALGHTGRPLESHPVLTAAYLLITLAAASRVLVVAVPDGRALLLVAGASWFLGFACFAWRYVPILIQVPVQSRLPVRPG